MSNKKYETIIDRLQKGSLNRFDAEKLGDHCLNTTVSDLRRRGYSIEDKWEKVPNRFGGESLVKRYWIASDEHQQPESNS